MRKPQQQAWKTWAQPKASDDLWTWQRGRCAWCGLAGYSLVRDHCHLTGLIRGLLCRGCNHSEGADLDGDWSGWRTGDNPAMAVKDFEVYVGIGGTTLWPESALNYYTLSEREEWWSATIAALRGGADWPLDAPWSDVATARREVDLEQFRQAFAEFPTIEAMFGGGAR